MSDQAKFAVGQRVRVIAGTCQGWIGVVDRSERMLQGAAPAAGKQYPRRYRLDFGDGHSVTGFDEAELEGA